jgi:hypothetical protein
MKYVLMPEPAYSMRIKVFANCYIFVNPAATQEGKCSS